MARIRTIKPEFPQSESMGRISRDARLCFIQLWTIADDYGRLRGNPRMLAGLLFPYDDDATGLIDGWLGELEREGCIFPYQCGRASYIQIIGWAEHQKIDKPTKSKIPAPPEDFGSPRESSRILASVSEEFANPREEVGSPRESSPLEGTKEEDQGKEEDHGKEKPRASRSAAPSRPDDVSEQVWADWCALRKAKKATVSETVLKEARAEAAKAHLPLERFLSLWCARGSQGLIADWLKPHERGAPTMAPRDRIAAANAEANAEAARLLGFNFDPTDAQGVIDA